MTVAICDDEQVICEQIENLLNLSWLKPRDSWEFHTNVQILTKLTP